MTVLPAFLAAAGAGAAVGWTVYKTVAIPDLLLWRVGDRARVLTLRDRFWQLVFWSWGPDSEAKCHAAHLQPTILLRFQIGGPLVLFIALADVLHLSWILAAAGALLLLGRLPASLIRSAAKARKAAILDELPDTFGPFLEAIKLQGDPVEAMSVGLRYANPGGPLHEEFRLIISETTLQRNFRGALTAFAKRVDHPLVYDLARTLTVAFERRLSPAALEQIKAKLAGLRVDLVEAATQAVPNYLSLAGGVLFFGYIALVSVWLYTLFAPNMKVLF